MNPSILNSFRMLLIGLCAVAPLLALPARANDLSDFLAQGRVLADVRYRFEDVDQQGFGRNADANTVRERLGYQTASFWDLKALVEVQANQHLSNGFNDTINGRTSYPQIPDPESFDLNRLQLSYSGMTDLTATLGRQVVNLDDQRFIGASAFRQNEQTFDAMRLDYTGLPGLSATYIYSDRVNRIFGNRSPAGHFNGNVHLFNAGYNVSSIGKLTGFTYLLDLSHSATLSTATYGIQLVGAQPLDDQFKLRYIAGYARQTGYADNPLSISLDYWRLEGGIDYEAWSLTGGVETLGGNGKVGFSTPLATLHAFQGEADAFLTTPPQGVADRYAKLGYQLDFSALGAPRKLNLVATYHDFSAAHGTGTLGHEMDFGAIIRIDDHWRLDPAYAAYDGTIGFASRNKIWLSLTYTY